MTYSIVARDPGTGQLGVAVQSAMLGAGRIVPWAQAGVGAVATQAHAEIAYGPELLTCLGSGLSAADALTTVLADDAEQATRQVGVVDASGRAAAHTGSSTIAETGQVVGDGWSTQANMMERPGVPEAMASAFEGATKRDLPHRLLAALDAAQAAGGDFRGRQAAGLIVVGATRKDRPAQGVIIDVRVEDHDEPLVELRRLTDLGRAYDQLFTEFDRLADGDVEGILLRSETLRATIAHVAEFTLLRINALLLGDDEDGAREEIRSFPGDPAVLRTYLTRSSPSQMSDDPGLLDRLFA